MTKNAGGGEEYIFEIQYHANSGSQGGGRLNAEGACFSSYIAEKIASISLWADFTIVALRFSSSLIAAFTLMSFALLPNWSKNDGK
jgi:hypothetical protein